MPYLMAGGRKKKLTDVIAASLTYETLYKIHFGVETRKGLS